MNNTISPLRILPAETTAIPREPTSDFGETLASALDEVDQLHSTARQQVDSLLQGQGADVHSAMIAVEKAELSFELMMQVRNKIVQAYQQVANMQF